MVAAARSPQTGDGRIAVVLMTCDRRDEAVETAERLCALPERPEVVVVDNGSRDGTAAAVASRAPAARILPLARNLGAAARNLGVRRVDAPYVAFCDDDTCWTPGSLARAADLLDADPALAVVNARILVGDDRHEDGISAEMADSPLPAPPGLPGAPLLSFLAGASVVRRAALHQVGGFEPRLFIGGEEELLAADLAAAGWRMAYVPEVVVEHRASRARDAHGRRRLGIRNTLWFAWLRRPARSALRRTVEMAQVVPRDRISLGGFADAARSARWVLAARRALPPAVEAGLRTLDADQLRSGQRRYVS